jgi:hypothetical protein
LHYDRVGAKLGEKIDHEEDGDRGFLSAQAPFAIMDDSELELE